MIGRTRLQGLMVWGSVIACLLILPLIFDSVLGIALLNQMGIAIIFALSYNMLLGQSGLLSFGHAVYFGLGGFLAIHFLNFMEDGSVVLPLPLVPIIGGFCGLIFAIFIGSFSTRRAGTVFAMISLGIGELIAASSLIFVAFFGGEEGVSGDRTWGIPVMGYEFMKDVEVYYLIAAWVFISALLMYLYTQTPAGRMAKAVRANAERAEFIGYNVRMVRYLSFMVAGLFAGVAGSLAAINYEILTEENLNAVTSGNVLLMAYIGGTGFFAGPVVGAALFTLLQSLLSNYTDIWMLYVGMVFLLTVLFAPNGLTGLIAMHQRPWRHGKLRTLIVPYLILSVPVMALVVSVIGLLELTHHVGDSLSGGPEMKLFFVIVDSHSVVPWVILAVMGIIAVLALIRLRHGLKDAWQSANAGNSAGDNAGDRDD